MKIEIKHIGISVFIIVKNSLSFIEVKKIISD